MEPTSSLLSARKSRQKRIGELGAHFSGMGYSALTHTALAAGDTDNRELISNASDVRQKSR